jgi:peptidoglycan/LPS O-acetylase OafA/YrhL
LLCLWSLAIEEHFYVVVPFFVRSLRLRSLAVLFTSIVVLEPMLRGVAFLAHVSSDSIYYLTPFRMDGLALGGLMACIIKSGVGEAKLKQLGGWLAVALWSLFILLTLAWPTFTKHGGSIAFEALGYSLVAICSFLTVSRIYWFPAAPFSKFLALAPIAYIGRISYGMYLFHPFILSIARHALGISTGLAAQAATRKLFIIDFPITIVMAFLSFRFIESPALGWGKRKVQALALNKDQPLSNVELASN